MDNEQLIKAVQDLTGKVSNLEGIVGAMKSSPKLDRNLDNISKDVILQHVQDNILSLTWEDYMYMPLYMAAQTNFTDTSVGGTFTKDDNGIILDSSSISTDTAGCSIGASAVAVKLTRETRMRAIVNINSLSAARGTVYTLLTGNNYVGFQFIDGTFYAASSNGAGTKSKIPLATFTASDYYELEVVYNTGVAKFYIDGVEKGAITTNLPDTPPADDAIVSVFAASIITTAAASKVLTIPYLDFIQRRK